MTSRTSRTLLTGAYAAVLLVALFLLFYKIDGRLLWSDEAETALLAKNVVKFGIPKTADGLNHFTLYGASVDGNAANVWTWSPWLQEYIVAASFKCFGVTTWAARAPFAFVGWLTLILFCFTIHKIYRNHWVTLSSLLLLSTSEAFLLHSRQCRYYTVSVFCEILFIYAAYRLLNRDQWAIGLMVLALVLQFYSNYIIAVANFPAIGVLAWMLFKENKRSLLWVIAGLGVFALMALPWLIYAQPWKQIGVMTDIYNPWQKILYYLGTFHFYFVPLVFALFPLGGFIAARLRHPGGGGQKSVSEIQSKWEVFLLWLLPLYGLMLLIPPGAYTRYLLPILPIGCLLAALWVFRYVRWKAVAVALILFQCLSNGISVVTGYVVGAQHPFRSPMVEFVHGFRPYQDRFADVVEYLNKEGRPGETVLVMDPEAPLIFYTQFRILDGRFFGRTLPDPLPDWILAESASGTIYQAPVELGPPLSTYYDKIILSVHDSDRGGNIPRPEIFQYQSVSARAPYVIYRKRPPSVP